MTLQTWWSSVGGQSGAGAQPFSPSQAQGESSWSNNPCSVAARAAALQAWCALRAGPRSLFSSGCGRSTSIAANTTNSGSTRGSSSRATSCPPLPRSRSPRPKAGSTCSVPSVSTWNGSSPTKHSERNPLLAKGICLGGSYASGDGYIDPPRNVLAYALVLQRVGVTVRERVGFRGLRVSKGHVTGVETTVGVIETDRVVLTGGPELASVGDFGGLSIPVGGARHQIAVTEPCPQLAPENSPMVFDVGAGLYWRPEDGGILFGMSNPDEKPGAARDVDWEYLGLMRERLAYLVPQARELTLRRTWAATIDFTPDHLPIIGPALYRSPRSGDSAGAGVGGSPEFTEIGGAVVASAGGHGMMWGPAVARATADLCLKGNTDIADISSVGLDRFDSEGRSSLAPDPIALPFPERILQP